MSELADRISALSPEKRAILERRLRDGHQVAARASSIPPRDRSVPCPPSFAQQRIWLLEQLAPMYSIPSAVKLTGDLDVSVLRRVLNEIVARHEVLRTTFELDGGDLQQRVGEHRELDVALIDLRRLPHDERAPAVERLALQEARRPFDLERDLLLRVTVLRLAEAEHVALLTTHHIAADGLSFGVLIREIAELYPAFRQGKPSPLPPIPVQYADFAVWQRQWLHGERLETHLAYWRERLGTTPPKLVLPADHPRPADPANEGAVHGHVLPAGLRHDLQAFADREGATLFMVVLAAVKVLLFRYTRQDDLIVGSTIANRTLPETERMVGCFVNTLVMRTDLSGDPDFRAVLGRVRETALGAYEHQDLPFEKLVEELHPQRELNETPLVQFMVNFENMPDVELELPGLTVAPLAVNRGVAHFDLTLTVAPTARGGLLTRWEYNTDLFEKETAAQLAAHLEDTLRQLTAAPDRPIRDMDLGVVGSSEPLATPAGWRDGLGGDGVSVVGMFEAQVDRVPGAVAVSCDGVVLSYAELDARAERVAGFLRSRGVGPEVPVAVFAGRSAETAVAVLGVLKAGGCFVLVDPAYPAARVKFMLADSAARIVLTRAELAGLVPATSAEVVALDAELPACGPPAGPRPAGAGNLAYVIYTSGSTGVPKGVMVEGRALASYTQAAVEAFGLGPGDRVLQFASPGFDVVIEELFPAWAAGAAVVTAAEIPADPAELVTLLEREGVTVVELPTAYWHEWVYQVTEAGIELPGCLRLVIIGGERVLPDRLARWQGLGIGLVHVYGLTETAVTSTVFPVTPSQDPAGWANLPVGRPIANTRAYVLDGRLRPAPIGGLGEIYIGGPGVGRGYYDRPGLTAQRFVADPFGGPGDRLYRTGDLGRFLRSGDIEFIGRVDNQVKIRGFRVEPGDIEAVLVRHPGLRESTVIVREDTPGDKRLTAYLVADGGQPPAVRELREFLGRELPAYMVPTTFVWLDNLPLSPNGKIDRAALPAPRAPLEAGREEAGPDDTAQDPAPLQGSVERTLAAIWADVIGLESVGADDNFFEIGGDSILSIQIVARARQASISLTPLDIFRHPTVAEQAQVAGHASAVIAEQDVVTGEFPALPLQRWFFGQGLPAPDHWNMAVLLEVRAAFSREVLEQALRQLVTHHDGLRQRFSHDDGIVQARIADTSATMPFDQHDLSGLTDEAQAREIERIGSRTQAALDIAHGPVIRAALFELGGGKPSRLMVVVHHLAVNGVSFRILLEDFQAACCQLSQGTVVALPVKTTSIKAWALRLNEQAGSAAVAGEANYWRGVLQAAPARLPADFPAGKAAGRNDVASARTVSTALGPAETTALLREVPSAYNTQINDVLLAALSRVLSGWTGSAANLVELESHGREPLFPDLDLSRTVGWITATYPVALEADLTGAPAPTLKATKERLRAVPNGGIGYGLLRYGGPGGGGIGNYPEPEVSFNYLGQFDQSFRDAEAFTLAPEEIGLRESPGNSRTHLLGIVGEIMDGQLRMHWTYSTNVHSAATVQHLADSYIAELRALIEHCVSKEAREYTPSDFPRARLSQSDLDKFIKQITISE